MSSENLKLKNQVCHPLYTASNAIVRNYDPHLKAIGLTYPQYLIMMGLWEQDEVPLSRLSEITLFDSGSLSPLVKRLVEKGFVAITPSKEDARVKLASLTKKGGKLKDEAKKIPELMFCQMQLSMNELQTLKKLLEKLRGNLSTQN